MQHKQSSNYTDICEIWNRETSLLFISSAHVINCCDNGRNEKPVNQIKPLRKSRPAWATQKSSQTEGLRRRGGREKEKKHSEMSPIALFITAKQTNPKCPSKVEWIDMIYMIIMEDYSTIKRNKYQYAI